MTESAVAADLQVSKARIAFVEPGVFLLTSGDGQVRVHIEDLTVDDAVYNLLSTVAPLTPEERISAVRRLDAATGRTDAVSRIHDIPAQRDASE